MKTKVHFCTEMSSHFKLCIHHGPCVSSEYSQRLRETVMATDTCILSTALSLVPINTEIRLNSRDENVHSSL